MSAPTKQDLGLTFVIDNGFANVLGLQVYPRKPQTPSQESFSSFCSAETLRRLRTSVSSNATEEKNETTTGNVCLGDIFNIALELPNVKAAIIPEYIYSWELQGKVYSPSEKSDFTQILKMESLHHLHDAADHIRGHADLMPHHELQAYLHSPTEQRGKLIIADGNYVKSIGPDIKAEMDKSIREHGTSAGYMHGVVALKKNGRLKGSNGEKQIVELIKNTNTGTRVCVLSDDESAFIGPDEQLGLTINKYKTMDKNDVMFSTTTNFFNELLSSEECQKYINQRLHEEKKLPPDVSLSASDVRHVFYDAHQDNLRQKEVIVAEKGGLEPAHILRESFSEGAKMQPTLKAIGASLPAQGANMTRPNYHHTHGMSI